MTFSVELLRGVSIILFNHAQFMQGRIKFSEKLSPFLFTEVARPQHVPFGAQRLVGAFDESSVVMPREHKKRGKRGEKKRKWEEDEGADDPKRPKVEQPELGPRRGSPDYALGETGDGMMHPDRAKWLLSMHSAAGLGDESYTPLEPETAAGDNFASNLEPTAEAAEFYGLLDAEEQAYFKGADHMLEMNQFATDDERALFLANVWNEARAKELKLANSQSCSRLLERLIQSSSTDQLRTLFQKFSGQ